MTVTSVKCSLFRSLVRNRLLCQAKRARTMKPKLVIATTWEKTRYNGFELLTFDRYSYLSTARVVVELPIIELEF